MPASRTEVTIPFMTPTYAVVWHSRGTPRHVGKLEVGSGDIRLSGAVPGGVRATIAIPFERVARVALGRSWHERLDGRPTVVVGLVGGEAVHIASLDGPGTVQEILQRLAPPATAAVA